MIQLRMKMEVLQYNYDNLKIETEKGVNKPLSEHDAALQEFISTGIDRTKNCFYDLQHQSEQQIWNWLHKR